MIQEHKELLLKDLCERLPYGVMIRIAGHDVNLTTYNTWIYFGATDEAKEYIKPYLRPMSNMNKKEYSILNDLTDYVFESSYDLIHDNIDELNEWLNVNHFDYRGLIKKGLALEAPEGMYNKIK